MTWFGFGAASTATFVAKGVSASGSSGVGFELAARRRACDACSDLVVELGAGPTVFTAVGTLEAQPYTIVYS